MSDDASRHTWAAIMLARRVDVCASVLSGRPVICRRLDGEVLRRALRGARLPPADSYLTVTPEHLDAVSEAGPLKLVSR